MKKSACAALILALAMLGASGADTTNSSTAEWPAPQLSANTNPGAEMPMARELDQPASPSIAPVPATRPAAAQSRNIWAVILAVLVLVVSRFVLRRLRSRAGQP